MSLYLALYDLDAPDQNYTGLISRLEEMGTYWHIQQSVWLVEWGGTAYTLAEDLAKFIDDGDKLLVTHVSADTAWSGYDDDSASWLRRLI